MPVPATGVEPWAVTEFASQIAAAGLERVILKSESEKPSLAFQGAVAATLRSKHGIEVVPEASYKDSQANGLAEHAVREVKAKVRQLVFGLKERYGKVLAPESPAMTWLVAFAALQINAARKGSDGLTAWELRYGRPFRRLVCDFEERVLWRAASPPDNQAVERVF